MRSCSPQHALLISFLSFAMVSLSSTRSLQTYAHGRRSTHQTSRRPTTRSTSPTPRTPVGASSATDTSSQNGGSQTWSRSYCLRPGSLRYCESFHSMLSFPTYLRGMRVMRVARRDGTEGDSCGGIPSCTTFPRSLGFQGDMFAGLCSHGKELWCGNALGRCRCPGQRTRAFPRVVPSNLAQRLNALSCVQLALVTIAARGGQAHLMWRASRP